LIRNLGGFQKYLGDLGEEKNLASLKYKFLVFQLPGIVDKRNETHTAQSNVGRWRELQEDVGGSGHWLF
jgi:hypothetical protein